jgi:hypothetical protein
MALTIKPGRYAISRIVANGRGGLTTAAMRQRLAPNMENHFPPLAGGAARVPWALVWLGGTVGTPDADTILLPDLSLDNTPTTTQRDAIRNAASGRLDAYEWDSKAIAAFDTSRVTTTTTAREILDLLLRYMQHSEQRTVRSLTETHNTEYTDDFSTNPNTRWQTYTGWGGYTWDSADGEVDMANDGIIAYTTSPGSIEHEAQATFLTYNTNGAGWSGGATVRMNTSTSVRDAYFTEWEPGSGTAGTLYLSRYAAGTYAELASYSFDIDTSQFWTVRIAAAGGAGANVVLTVWYSLHGTSKPSDPGWYGVDGSPDRTYTDTAASRLDETANSLCGMGSGGASTEYDTRHDFFKVRAISDRGGGAGDDLIEVVGETVALAEVAQRTIAFRRLFLEGIVVAEAPVRRLALHRLATEGVSVTEAAIRLTGLLRAVAEDVAVTEVVQRLRGATRVVADAVGIGEAAARISGLLRAVGETVGLAEVAAFRRALSRRVSEGIGVGETVTRLTGLLRRITESVSLTETAARGLGFVRMVAESVGLTETAARVRGLLRAVGETVGVAEDIVRHFVAGVVALVAVISETVGVTEAAQRLRGTIRAVADTVGIGEAVGRTRALRRAVAEVVNAGETVRRARTLARHVAETVGITEALVRARTLARHASETVNIGETPRRVKGLFRVISDAVGILETLVRRVAQPGIVDVWRTAVRFLNPRRAVRFLNPRRGLDIRNPRRGVDFNVNDPPEEDEG